MVDNSFIPSICQCRNVVTTAPERASRARPCPRGQVSGKKQASPSVASLSRQRSDSLVWLPRRGAPIPQARTRPCLSHAGPIEPNRGIAARPFARPQSAPSQAAKSWLASRPAPSLQTPVAFSESQCGIAQLRVPLDPIPKLCQVVPQHPGRRYAP